MIPALIATSVVFLLLAAAGFTAHRRLVQPHARRTALAAGLLLALPCVAFAAYYLHWWDEPVLLYRFRALPGSELAAGLSGWLTGWCGRLLITHQRQMVREIFLLHFAFFLNDLLPREFISCFACNPVWTEHQLQRNCIAGFRSERLHIKFQSEPHFASVRRALFLSAKVAGFSGVIEL